MSGSELASEAADLLSLANASEPRSLNQLVTLATRQVRACSGAMADIWHDREPVMLVASHPDLPELFEAQAAAGRGPVFEALAGSGPVGVPDTLQEARWPEYARAALRRGVRCSITLAWRQPAPAGPPGRETVTLSLVGARPRTLQSSQLELAELLIAYGGTVVGNAVGYRDAQRTARQLRDAAESRTVVDQARGMLMQAMGCTAEDAMQWLRRMSQERNLRVAEVASRILDAAGNGGLKRRAAR